jgi:hypothetical protein
MGLIDRVKGTLLEPKTEWPKIAAEPVTVQSLYTGWIMILAALGPVALVLRTFGGGIGVAIVGYAIALALVYVVAMIVDALAPTFGGEKNMDASLKLVAYAMTAAWVGGAFQILPFIGWLVAIAGAIYSIYLFYLGAPVLRKCSADKAVGLTIVIVLCQILLQVVFGSILLAAMFGGNMMTMMM